MSQHIFASAAYDSYNKLPSPAPVAVDGQVFITNSGVHSATTVSDAIYFKLTEQNAFLNIICYYQPFKIKHILA